MPATIWSLTGRGKEQTGTLSCLRRECTTGNTAKKAGRCEKDSGLFQSFISQDDPKVIMENSSPKGYLQDHTVISATHSRIFTESKGITPNLHWQDQDQNLTRSKQKPNMPQAARTIISPWGVKAMETSVILMHFSDWKYSSPIVPALQNILELILCFWALLTDSFKRITDKLTMAWAASSEYPLHCIWESCNGWSTGWGCVLGRGSRPSTVSAQLIPKCKPHWAVEHNNKNLLT